MDSKSSIELFISSYDDWRAVMLQQLRELIDSTVPELTSEIKWGVPVWKHKKLVCAISAFKDHVKMKFF